MADERASWRPPDRLVRWAATAACALVIGAAALAGLLLLARLRLVLVPIVIAVFLTRALIVPADALERLGWRPGLRAATVLVGFLATIAAIVLLVAPPLADELSDLGPTLRDGVEQVEDWIVREGPVDVDRAELEELEEQAVEQVRGAATGATDRWIAGAQLALETVAGVILALILTFFALKDGQRLQGWLAARIPAPRRASATAMAAASWTALGGYLRGAALLGIVEATIIGVALLLVGASLVLPIALLTFAAAFLPIVGATLAGVAAVLVALVTAGTAEALIVAAVAVAVQQLDNDLLAPWIYGRALELHPAAILLSITTGTALFGFVGAVLAVPLVAMVTSALAARNGGEVVPPAEDAVPAGADP